MALLGILLLEDLVEQVGVDWQWPWQSSCLPQRLQVQGLLVKISVTTPDGARTRPSKTNVGLGNAKTEPDKAQDAQYSGSRTWCPHQIQGQTKLVCGVSRLDRGIPRLDCSIPVPTGPADQGHGPNSW